jgi:uncharacterized membrane protein YbhN (UPF0104 family)
MLKVSVASKSLTRVAAYVCILVGFTAAVEYIVGWRSLLSPWLSTNPSQLLFAIALILATYAIRALRICRYFEGRGAFGAWLRLLLQHNLMLNLLPMRAGEFAFPILMNRYFDVPSSRSLPALLWLRILDLHTLLLILFLVVTWIAIPAAVLPVALIWLAALPLLVHAAKKVSANLGLRDSRIARLGSATLAGMPQSAIRLTESWAWTMLSWALKLAVFGWVFSTLSSTTYLNGLLAAMGGELSSILPVHGPAGAGTYEAGVAAAVLPVGVPVQEAIIGAVNLHLFVLGVSMVSAFVSLFGRPIVREARPLARQTDADLVATPRPTKLSLN